MNKSKEKEKAERTRKANKHRPVVDFALRIGRSVAREAIAPRTTLHECMSEQGRRMRTGALTHLVIDKAARALRHGGAAEDVHVLAVLSLLGVRPARACACME